MAQANGAHMLLPYDGHAPQVDPTAFVAPDANLIGRVRLGAACSVWFGATLRADNDLIEIGARTSLQEGCICHTDAGLPLQVGEDCVIGHAAVLHGCTVGQRVLVGIGAVVLNRAVLEDDVLVGAGSLVPERAHLTSGGLYLGSPARRVRDLKPEELQRIRASAAGYVEKAGRYNALLGQP